MQLVSMWSQKRMEPGARRAQASLYVTANRIKAYRDCCDCQRLARQKGPDSLFSALLVVVKFQGEDEFLAGIEI
jgi:hypothetical protein